MIRSERGDPCKHPVRPPIPNTCCWIRGRRAFESGNVEVVDKGIRGVFPVEDADDAAEGELVVGRKLLILYLPLINRLSPRGTVTN